MVKVTVCDSLYLYQSMSDPPRYAWNGHSIHACKPPAALAQSRCSPKIWGVTRWNGTPFLESDLSWKLCCLIILVTLRNVLDLAGLPFLFYQMGRKNNYFREQLRELMRKCV